jgi:Tol biopolymer transport system component
MRFDLASDQMTSMFGGTEKLNLANCSGDVVLVRTASGIAARGLGAGPEKEIYRPAPHSGTLAPVISHDGRTVAFVTPGVGAPVAGMSVLHVVSSDGGPVRDLASSNSPAEFQAYWGVTWSPDDRFVYFARRPDGKSPYELLRVPATGGTPEGMGLKVEDLRDLDIAPDGTRIAFSIGAVNRPEIWAIQKFLPVK